LVAAPFVSANRTRRTPGDTVRRGRRESCQHVDRRSPNGARGDGDGGSGTRNSPVPSRTAASACSAPTPAKTIKLNVRTFDADVRRRVLAGIERIANAEAAASGAPRPPQITTTEHYPLLTNDPAAASRVAAALRARFDDDRVHELALPYSASEDFGSFGTEWGVPSVFWYAGGTDVETYRQAQRTGRVADDIPTNHNPHFAPVIYPRLRPASRP
jgi:metal-dependent amidase/aminoacylase/carboxypeptidase family protein